MMNRIHKLLGSVVLAGTMFQMPGRGMQDVASGVVDTIKGGVAETTVGITELLVESWLDTAFPSE